MKDNFTPTDAMIEAVARAIYFSETGGPDCWSDETDEVLSQFRRRAMRSLEPTPLPEEIKRVCEILAIRASRSRSMMDAQSMEKAIAIIRSLAAEVERLSKAMVDHNDALRSAAQVANRDGQDTNWLSFRGTIHWTLAEHHEITNQARATLNRTEASHEG